MKIIISPAKKMEVCEDYTGVLTKPIFLEKTKILLDHLKKLSYEDMKKLLNTSENLTSLNYEIYKNFSLNKLLSPALFSFKGLAFTYMAPQVFSKDELVFLENRLFILSGLFGILRPFDAISPYRLEMMANLSSGKSKNLYEFWGDLIYREIFKSNDTVLNLASVEYSKCLSKYLKKDDKFIDIYFLEYKDNKLLQKASYSKMARGSMVRFIAENKIQNIEELKSFTDLSYCYSKSESKKNKLVFIKKSE